MTETGKNTLKVFAGALMATIGALICKKAIEKESFADGAQATLTAITSYGPDGVALTNEENGKTFVFKAIERTAE